MLAAYKGRASEARQLLDKDGVQVNASRASKMLDEATERGCTALAMAAQEGHVDVAKLLLQHGCNVDTASLLAAVKNGHAEVGAALACWGVHHPHHRLWWVTVWRPGPCGRWWSCCSPVEQTSTVWTSKARRG
jgi:hypothetical protein